MKRGALPPLVALALLVATVPALGYLKLGTRVGTGTANLKWTSQPIRYFVTDRGTTGVTAEQFQSVWRRPSRYGARSTPPSSRSPSAA